jgi:integration host factor subunit beta
MLRSDLVQKMSDANPELAERNVEAVVTAFFDEIAARMAAGGRVELRGFGVFSTRARDPRTARNPKNGELVELKARRVPWFKTGKELLAKLNLP